MSKAKYNVLMMRDNTPVRRYRLSPVWLKLALYMLLLLLACAGAGGYFGLQYWKSNQTLSEELGGTQRELREARIELERLQNIDQILKSNNPEELQSLLGTSGEAPKPKAPVTPPPPPVNLSKLLGRIDLQHVRVDNFQAKAPSDRTLQIVFNLNNLQTVDTISGEATMAVLTNDGKEQLPQLNKNDLLFQIQRFKQITTSFKLPGGLTRADVFGLRLVIKNNSGQVVFSDVFPLANILS